MPQKKMPFGPLIPVAGMVHESLKGKGYGKYKPPRGATPAPDPKKIPRPKLSEEEKQFINRMKGKKK